MREGAHVLLALLARRRLQVEHVHGRLLIVEGADVEEGAVDEEHTCTASQPQPRRVS